MERDQVSLNTVHGRVVCQFDLGAFQRQSLSDLTWKIGGADLIRQGSVWYLCITQSKPLPEPDEQLGIIGVDRGSSTLRQPMMEKPSVVRRSRRFGTATTHVANACRRWAPRTPSAD